MTAVVAGVLRTSVCERFRVPSGALDYFCLLLRVPGIFPGTSPAAFVRPRGVTPALIFAQSTAPDSGRDARVTTQVATQNSARSREAPELSQMRGRTLTEAPSRRLEHFCKFLLFFLSEIFRASPPSLPSIRSPSTENSQEKLRGLTRAVYPPRARRVGRETDPGRYRNRVPRWKFGVPGF
jgi:hypothetical protein